MVSGRRNRIVNIIISVGVWWNPYVWSSFQHHVRCRWADEELARSGNCIVWTNSDIFFSNTHSFFLKVNRSSKARLGVVGSEFLFRISSISYELLVRNVLLICRRVESFIDLIVLYCTCLNIDFWSSATTVFVVFLEFVWFLRKSGGKL